MYEQERFIVRLRQRLLADPTVESAWLGGSFGRSANDPYSALDITLVFGDDTARADAWRRRAEFCHNILAYVPARSIDAEGHDHCHITLFGNGSLARFRFESRASLAPRADDQQIKIIKESEDGWAAAHAQRSGGVPAYSHTPTSAGLRLIDDHFWVGFWEVYRQLRRGATDPPFAAYVTLLAETLLPLLDWLPPSERAYQDLIDVQYSRDAGQTLRHLRRLLDAYRAARQALIERYQLDYQPDRAFETQIERAFSR